MATAEGLRVRVRRPSAPGLAGEQVGYQLRLLIRSPIAAFMTLVIPLMVLLAVDLMFSGTRIASRGDIRFAQFFTPAMVCFAVLTVCYMTLITSTVQAREAGILKRVRSTPLPPWAYLAGQVGASAIVALVAGVAVVAVGALVYGFALDWSTVPAALLTIAVASFAFCALGLAVTVLVPTVDAALPVAWGTALPLCFISDIFQPIDRAPAWLRDASSLLPLRPFAHSLESLANPVTGGAAVDWGDLATLAAWGAAAALFALARFRWQPKGP